MSWINENWLWIVIAVAFLAVLLSSRGGRGHGGQGGHGCCGGHDDHAEKKPQSPGTQAHSH